MPVRGRNTVVKWLGVRNPTDRAISAIGRVWAANNTFACSIRR